jgi:hypothetical protein
MWKVCAEVTVPLSARLNCKVHERRLDEHLGDERGGRGRAWRNYKGHMHRNGVVDNTGVGLM